MLSATRSDRICAREGGAVRRDAESLSAARRYAAATRRESSAANLRRGLLRIACGKMLPDCGTLHYCARSDRILSTRHTGCGVAASRRARRFRARLTVR